MNRAVSDNELSIMAHKHMLEKRELKQKLREARSSAGIEINEEYETKIQDSSVMLTAGLSSLHAHNASYIFEVALKIRQVLLLKYNIYIL